MGVLATVLTLATVGCTRAPERNPRAEPDPRTTAPTTVPTLDTAPASPTGHTGHTGDTGPALDCAELPEAVFVRHMANMPSTEDFTFDDEGYTWGVSTVNGGLIRTLYDGTPEVMKPNVSSWGRGARFLPGAGGDLLVAERDTGSLLRFDRDTMGTTVVHAGYNEPNGLAIGEDGMVHLTQGVGPVVRVDPDTGEQSVIHDSNVSTDGITFAPDYQRLYWDSEYGQIATAVIDADGVVTEEASVLTTIDVEGSGLSILDGMAADACGNLYVVRMSGQIIRVTPDGTQSLVIDLSMSPAASLISAVNFGSGVGGWERDHLYVMSLLEGMFEIDVGIEGKPEPHLTNSTATSRLQ
jgi:sugar lactone lactonase YvrE